jgi:hypothetical protein
MVPYKEDKSKIRWVSFLGLLFDSKDEGDMFFRNVWFSPDYTELQPT